MSATDAESRERLEAERDFLLRSLDDLESERSAGGIDDESYTQLHDDYTARAAATIRALRDGVDARPAGAPIPGARRALVVVGIVVVAAGSGVALASAIGGRAPGETASGNSQPQVVDRGVADARDRLEAAVEDDPNDIGNRLLLARYLEEDSELAGALEQYDVVLALDPENIEALSQSGRVLYLGAVAAPERAGELVEEARSRLDQAITLDPEHADARFFRAIILANEFQDFDGAQGDLQRYLVLAPEGLFAQQARALLAEVTAALEPRATTTTT